MKKSIFLIVLCVGILFSVSTMAVCFLSERENTTKCMSSDDETCCIVQYRLDDQDCFEGWCHDTTQCVWQMILSPTCLDPEPADP